ncbi:2-amino-4-hydroxy-6-hydroxymethyldihydropteridine diphosphokinase [Streptococcus caviae]|uniref:2-amino-4-hydroxy-6- hydroxymethyldihydropteridine diphosphokinase n=1 Tax=Streptococcus sp. 'caviae' TaxID=1915004 RepID=UPI00094BB7F2|nr:2-amino-4-hydroxy-6-hydroxymethyldihydropteridine diphosphokinase [Streptococcus sp. 'caviae']OLN83929.1 2-amino-4-hydroxy-6-hydroxymethyldihydropteridine diphosphokinase [Streptococcus sp. 'caviae']
MTAVYLGLGSNIENREAYLEKALASLAELPHTRLINQSVIYETAAWGKTDQADFLNVVCQLETDLSPQELLQSCQNIEKQLGRIRHEHWGPRTIDIDILFYGHEIIDKEELQVPHPYLQDRAFVLVPLNDIAGSLIHPLLKQSIADLLQRVDKSGVKPLKN